MIPQFTSLIMSLALLGKPSRASDDALHFPFPEGSYPQPFQLNLDESFVEKTLRKVKDYRPTNGLSTEWDMEGPPKETIENVAKYWSTEYDWRAVEKNINTDFHHFATTVSGHGNYTQSIPLHFIHHTSDSDDAIPLLLLHGWPSSFLEWSKVIEPLTQHTGQSFHIVAPDLPGFGLSPAPRQPDLGPREMAKAFDELMHQLGYEKYGIVTTDLGWFVGMWMVNEVEDNIIGHMTDFFLTPPTDSDRARIQSGQASSEETSYITALDNWFTSHWAYATAHGQKPLALGQALGDTPVGLLGWLWDVAHAVGDGYNFGYEQLITDTMMLWIPGPYANMRAYLEIFKPYVMQFPSSKVPTGVSEWGWGKGPWSDVADFAFAPREWIKRVASLVYFKRHQTGGHYPAVNKPDVWVHDVREFFTQLDNAKASVKDEL